MYLFDSTNMAHITLAGSVSVPAPNEHFRRKPIENILYLITRGQMRFVDDGIEYLLKKGDIIIMNPSGEHYGLPTDSDVEYHYIHFTAEGLRYEKEMTSERAEQLLLEKRIKNGDTRLIFPKIMQLNLHDQEELLHLLQLIQEEYFGKNIYYNELADSLFSVLLTKLSRAYTFQRLSDMPKQSDLIVQLINYIKSHSREHISSENLEKEFHINFDHMNRCFKKKTGYTILFYANRYKIEEAKALLRSGAYNVKETAEKMGFSNEFYFSRVFKKYEGITPSEYIRLS